MRLAIVILFAALFVPEAVLAEEDRPEALQTCHYGEFSGLFRLGGVSGLEIGFAGKLSWNADLLRLEATNAITQEVSLLIANKSLGKVTLLYPDTLTGVEKSIPADDPLWIIMAKEPTLEILLAANEWECEAIAAKEIQGEDCLGWACNGEAGQEVRSWWNEAGIPTRVELELGKIALEVDISMLKLVVVVEESLFIVGQEFSVKQLGDEEKLEPFQL